MDFDQLHEEQFCRSSFEITRHDRGRSVAVSEKIMKELMTSDTNEILDDNEFYNPRGQKKAISMSRNTHALIKLELINTQIGNHNSKPLNKIAARPSLFESVYEIYNENVELRKKIMELIETQKILKIKANNDEIQYYAKEEEIKLLEIKIAEKDKEINNKNEIIDELTKTINEYDPSSIDQALLSTKLNQELRLLHEKYKKIIEENECNKILINEFESKLIEANKKIENLQKNLSNFNKNLYDDQKNILIKGSTQNTLQILLHHKKIKNLLCKFMNLTDFFNLRITNKEIRHLLRQNKICLQVISSGLESRLRETNLKLQNYQKVKNLESIGQRSSRLASLLAKYLGNKAYETGIQLVDAGEKLNNFLELNTKTMESSLSADKPLFSNIFTSLVSKINTPQPEAILNQITQKSLQKRLVDYIKKCGKDKYLTTMVSWEEFKNSNFDCKITFKKIDVESLFKVIKELEISSQYSMIELIELSELLVILAEEYQKQYFNAADLSNTLKSKITEIAKLQKLNEAMLVKIEKLEKFRVDINSIGRERDFFESKLERAAIENENLKTKLITAENKNKESTNKIKLLIREYKNLEKKMSLLIRTNDSLKVSAIHALGIIEKFEKN